MPHSNPTKVSTTTNSIEVENCVNGSNAYLEGKLYCPICQNKNETGPCICEQENLKNGSCKAVIQDLHSRLHAVSTENMVLRAELEVLQKALTSKCEAVTILKSTNVQYDGQACNNLFEENLNLKKDIKQLQTQLDLSVGAAAAQEQVSQYKCERLNSSKNNLTQQLENLQSKTKQLLEENIYLLRKNAALMNLCTYLPMSIIQQDFINSSSGNSIYLDRHTLQNLADQNANLSSDALFFCMSNPPAVQNPNPQLEPNPNPKRPHQHSISFLDRLQTLGKRSTSERHTSKLAKTTRSERECQCDLTSFISCQMSIYDMHIPLCCPCQPGTELPCACAMLAIRIQRDLLRYKYLLDVNTNKLHDSKISGAALRMALEEQFKKNQEMSVQLSSILPPIPVQSLKSNLSNGTALPNPVKQISLGPQSMIDLLGWFQRVLKSTAIAMSKLNNPNKPYISDNRTKFSNEYRSSKRVPKGYLKPGCSVPNMALISRENSFDSHTPSPGQDFLYRSRSRTNLGYASRRRINRRNSRSNGRYLMVESYDDLNIQPSDGSASPPSPTRPLSTSDLPEQVAYQRRVTRSSSAHAQRLRSKIRCSYRLFDNPVQQTVEADNRNTSILSELLIKINELSELITKQQLLTNLNSEKSDLSSS